MKKEEILARCIDEVRNGKSTIEDCIARYPELTEQLISLLEIAVKVKADNIKPTPEFKLRAKRYLFEKMQESRPRASHGLRFWPKHALTRVLASALIGLIVLGGAGGSVVYAAQGSLPGDTLYTVKTGVENIQLTLTSNPVAKANLHLELAQRRVDEVTRQVDLDRNINSQSLNSVKQQLDGALSELTKSKDTEAVNKTLSRMSADTLGQQLELENDLENASQSNRSVLQQAITDTHRGNTIAQVAYDNKDFLDSRPSVNDKELDAGPFRIEGNLQSIRDGTWNIGGTVLQNIRYPGKYPTVGSNIVLQGIVNNGNVFISSINVSENSTGATTSGTTTVEGQYSGINQNGTANISGIPVEIDKNDNSQLQPGDKVQLQGEAQSDKGKLRVTGKESQQQQEQAGTTVSGVLTAVNTSNGTVTVNVTGNQLTINVGQSEVANQGQENGTSDLSDLKHQIGHNINLSGLSKKDNNLFARGVHINSDQNNGN